MNTIENTSAQPRLIAVSSPAETVTLVVRVRNVGKETMKLSYLHPFMEHSPAVTDSDGKAVPQPEVLPA